MVRLYFFSKQTYFYLQFIYHNYNNYNNYNYNYYHNNHHLLVVSNCNTVENLMVFLGDHILYQHEKRHSFQLWCAMRNDNERTTSLQKRYSFFILI